MPYSDYSADKVNDHVLRGHVGGTSYSQPTQIKASLHSSDPGPDNDPDTEISGGSYERQTITFGPSSGGISSNDAEVTFLLVPTTSVTHVALWDELGNMIWHDDITLIGVSSGDNIRIPVGGLKVQAKKTD